MKNILPKGHTFPTENTGESNLGNLTAIFLPWQKTTSADVHVIVQSRSQRPRYLVSDGDRDKGNPWGSARLDVIVSIHLHRESIPLDDQGFYALKWILQ